MSRVFQNKNLRIFLASLMLIGVMFSSFVPLSLYAAESSEEVSFLDSLRKSLVQLFDDENEKVKEFIAIIEDERVTNIRQFFSQWDFYVPAADYAEVFVEAGDRYGVNPYLVAAIAFMESSGFQEKFMCGDNGFGWNIPPGHKCRDQFESITHAIFEVTKHLGGHYEGTARYYRDKSIVEIVNAYNPPTINPSYWPNIQSTMRKMASYSDTVDHEA